MFQMNYSRTQKGFTLLEILITLAIVVILSAIIIVPFSNFRASKLLEVTSNEVVSLLVQARADTISSKNASQYGVHFEASRVVLFAGDTFVDGNPGNFELSIDPVLQISNITLAGSGSDVIFERITGSTAQPGTVMLGVVADASQFKIITIDPAGVAEQVH